MDPRSILFAKNKRLALRIFVASRLSEKETFKEFDLEQFTEDKCRSLFRFKKSDIYRIRKLLLIPFHFVCKSGTTCSGTEALCILLRRLAYPNRLRDLCEVFGRPWKEIGIIFNAVLRHVFEKFGYLLDDLNQWWLSNEYLRIYSDAVAHKGSPLKNCWGFIDGTVRPTCKPGRDQKECFNGHKRCHGIKFQSIVAPNGLIANMYGPIEGRRHDAFMLSESNILPQLQAKNENEAEPFCIYGDPAYPQRVELQCPFKGTTLSPQQLLFNKKMSGVRINVEWGFKNIISNWAFVDFKKNMKLHLQPVGIYYKMAALLSNIHTCIHGSQISTCFNLSPPELEQYLIPQI